MIDSSSSSFANALTSITSRRKLATGISLRGTPSGTQQQPSPSPAFEVVSVKPNKSGDSGSQFRIERGGHVTWRNVTLSAIVNGAYQRFEPQAATAARHGLIIRPDPRGKSSTDALTRSGGEASRARRTIRHQELLLIGGEVPHPAGGGEAFVTLCFAECPGTLERLAHCR